MSNELVMETCLLAGEIMLKSGAETYRVEDTMQLLAGSVGMESVHSFVTPTSIIFSYRAGDEDHTRMIRIPNRTIDLNKVTLVNEVSRQLVSGQISLQEAYSKLLEIDLKKTLYPPLLLHLAAGLASGSFAVLIGGNLFDFLLTIVSGFLVNLTVSYVQQILQVKLFAEFVAAFVGGIVVLQAAWFFPVLHLDLMLIGTMIPLFPGIAVTNSLRDLMAGDLVAGVSRGVEAVLTALSVAVAAAIVLSFVG
ncbi:threonine/serine exporter family protein [Brevibacillus humidisoli]|nr:threonine/serine exporter family protein [Brevibacillus humidisoli]UFJ43402.1 threonine/serine exporter family protein [Brevibacillus humidisoli]